MENFKVEPSGESFLITDESVDFKMLATRNRKLGDPEHSILYVADIGDPENQPKDRSEFSSDEDFELYLDNHWTEISKKIEEAMQAGEEPKLDAFYFEVLNRERDPDQTKWPRSYVEQAMSFFADSMGIYFEGFSAINDDPFYRAYYDHHQFEDGLTEDNCEPDTWRVLMGEDQSGGNGQDNGDGGQEIYKG
ncbi:hypothetical protein GCM10023149_53990 [Mucilaginibacter gynuensis]|uniref:Uncharacterized protein n=1 Tax=Mucilaginibacter gynuensis TaxID=1302236 RepID=A0ABP8HN35_9SPHI